MHEATICIFAKPPRPGETKTRLAPAIGADNAARVAQALLEDVIDTALRVPGASVVLSVTESFALLGRSLQIWLQPEGDLRVRIEHALSRALLESRCAIAVGADTPGLTPAMLDDAIRRLDSCDAVIGPAQDGGYYLLGLRRCPPDLLRNIRWSHRATLDDTIARFQQLGVRYSLLPKWFDLDTPKDLTRMRYMLSAKLITAPHLRTALHSIGILNERPMA